MKRHVMGMVAAAASAVIGASSQAATNVADLQDITFTLADLNPGDGVDPQFYPFGVQSGWSVVLDGYSPGGPGNVVDGFLSAGTIVVPFGSQPDAGASGSMSPGLGIAVEADAAGAGISEIAGSSAGNWFVTPFTSVTLTANSLFQSTASAGSEIAQLCLDVSCSFFESAVAGSTAHSYSVTYTNDTAQYVGILVSVEDGATAVAANVPEPPAGWLLVAGGGLVGLSRLRAGKRVA